MEKLYDAITKRRSMRKYDDALKLTDAQRTEIRVFMRELTPLDGSIRTDFELVPRALTTAKFGEYCALLFSEDKPLAALNAGYMLEQLDLYLAQRDVGACWYGLARTDLPHADGLKFMILLALGQCRPTDFRQGAVDFSRRAREEIWTGAFDPDAVDAARLAPSACNSQPWRYVSEGDRVTVYRETALRSFVPPSRRAFFNSIDVGISMLCFEQALLHKGLAFERTLCAPGNREGTRERVAEYRLV